MRDLTPSFLLQIIPALVAEGFSATAAANTLSLLAAMGVLSKLFFGWLSEKITAHLALAVCKSIQIVALVLFVSARADYVYVLACGLFGLGFGGVGALLPLVAMDTFGHAMFGQVKRLVQMQDSSDAGVWAGVR